MSWSNKYLGIPYKAGDTDCWGLVCKIYKNELGIILPRYSITNINLEDKLTEIDKVYNQEKCRWLKVNEPFKAFDVIMFHLGGRPLHTGVIIDKEYMIHSESRRAGSCVENYRLQKWEKRIIGVYRYDKNII